MKRLAAQTLKPAGRRPKMMTVSEIQNQTCTVVFESLALPMAAVVCSQLELAGLPAELCQADGGYAVRVPDERASESVSLLNGEEKTGEILLYKRNGSAR
jgi:hypothetical protein